MKPRVLGLDIGGATLKAAHINGTTRSQPFAVWKEPGRLAEQLRQLLAAMPPSDLLAVTMTAELCDCYATKHAGVNAILDAVEAVAGRQPVLVWQHDGTFTSIAAARGESLKTASANWLALATFAGRYCPTGPAVLIDIGSTTTDLIPILDGVPVPRGRTDPERLMSHELVYMGVSRTPLCAVLDSITWRGQTCRPAAEVFATTQDAYVLLACLPEDAGDCSTADGQPVTRPHAHARLARMICADTSLFRMDDALDLARQVRQRQVTILQEVLTGSCRTLPASPRAAILSGSGEFLAHEVLASTGWQLELISLAKRLGPGASRAACACALAVLASERA